MADNLRATFAVNLRAQCAKFPSIAHVCRGTGINRQQFNKYLAGEYLPNPKTRKTLCEFLGISQAQMFDEHSEFTAPEVPLSLDRQKRINSILQSDVLAGILATCGLKSTIDHTRLLDGYYHCYFPLQNHPEFLVRSALKISSYNSMRVFARHTHFVSVSFPTKMISKGRHVGVVVGNEIECYFLGINQITPKHLSLLTFPYAQLSGNSLLAGTGLTRGTSSAHASRVCLDYLGTTYTAGRKALTGISVTTLRQADVPPLISTIMTTSRESGVTQVSPLMLEASFAAQVLSTMVTKQPIHEDAL